MLAVRWYDVAKDRESHSRENLLKKSRRYRWGGKTVSDGARFGLETDNEASIYTTCNAIVEVDGNADMGATLHKLDTWSTIHLMM